MSETADIVIVGAGASGAAFAWRLAGSGLKVVCLERGDWIDQRHGPSLTRDWELALQTDFHANPNIRQGPADHPVVDENTPIKPAFFNGVGGSTVRWGAHFPRFHPSDFKTRTLDGVAEDWPLDYADLAPYYDLNDRMMGVSGLAGDPANPPRAARPRPPLPLCPATEQLAKGFDRLGWHWWPSDAAIVSGDYGEDRAACNNCGPCGLGCVRHARASADIVYWPPALRGCVELRTRTTVTALESHGGQRVERLHYRRGDGTEGVLSPGYVVLAGNGLGSARLLLASNLANGSDLVGRNLMLHPTAVVTGVFEQNFASYRGAFACSLFSQEFYETDRRRSFKRGFQLQALREQGPVVTALGGYGSRLPWGADHHRSFNERFGRSISLTVTCEDLPDPENRIDLDPVRSDRWGLPIPRMHYRLGENSRAMLTFGIAQAREVLRVAGAKQVVVNELAANAGFHLLGTTRCGRDPLTSVVDDGGFSHEVGNLMVVDGGVFPSASAVNPTPTIQAFALRAADALLHRLGLAGSEAA